MFACEVCWFEMITGFILGLPVIGPFLFLLFRRRKPRQPQTVPMVCNLKLNKDRHVQDIHSTPSMDGN